MGFVPQLVAMATAEAEPAGCRFYLGTHHPDWLRRLKVPLFVARQAMAALRRPTPAYTAWALDSGGFNELRIHGRWRVDAKRYAAQMRLWATMCGRLEWAAVQDWMCEDVILAETGLDVAEHQRRTIQSYLDLTALEPGLPWVPVLQGYQPAEYLDHLRQYAAAGVLLSRLPLVGVGSVCRRQHADVTEAERIIRSLHDEGLRLHAFGFKVTGLARCARYLASADSMAWSRTARLEKICLPGHSRRHATCANCPDWALRWRGKVLDAIAAGESACGNFSGGRNG